MTTDIRFNSPSEARKAFNSCKQGATIYPGGKDVLTASEVHLRLEGEAIRLSGPFHSENELRKQAGL